MKIGWKQSLTELDNYSRDEQRYILALALRRFDRDQVPRDPSRQEELEAVQSSLLSFPDHATYYQNKLESMRAEALENAKIPYDDLQRLRDVKTVVLIGDYEDFRPQVFSVLGLLPSPQSVAVLGHFLDDPEDRNIRLGGNPIPFPPNCGAAARALNKLGIENPPNKGFASDPRWTDFDLKEVEAWADWWHEVKAGKRTYRFIGSDIEYGPDGPASKEVIERSGRDRKRDEEREKGHRKGSTASEATTVVTRVRKPTTIAGLLAASALVAGAVLYFLRARNVA